MKTKIQQLIKIIEDSNIDELEVSTFWGGQKIRVTKNRSNDNVQPIVMSQPVAQQSQFKRQPIAEDITNEKSHKQQDNEDFSLTQISEETVGEKFAAPLVGTFYAASKPGAEPFVKEGDTISKGQIVCIIEAMKIFNEIEAEHSGIIKKILVKDATPVEYGQTLMIIE